MSDGSKITKIEGSLFLATTKTYIDENNDVAANGNKKTDVKNSKMIIFLNKSEAELPNIVYEEFLRK